MHSKQFIILISVCCFFLTSYAENRWRIHPDGGIIWEIKSGLPHYDHIEMSGEQISVILRYGVDENNVFKLNRSLVFPMLRTLPNNTHASLTQRFHIDIASLLIVNGLSLENRQAKSISLNGKLTVVSTCEYANMGAARYALALGNYDTAKELWPLITWCLEYCNRKLNAQGVVTSDSDELEGRFPAGSANLCTSSLYYDALISAAYLGRETGQNAASVNKYKAQAKQLRKNIESYFGSNVQGFDTYRYYEGNDVLRSWICIPLTVGIDERSEATINALFSPFLWTDNGLLTQAGDSVFWDRSTLYGLRAAYMAGYTEKATHYLKAFSTKRLLGDHVPYPVESYPDGNQRHLSAESGLYCRIITEGLFGIRPTGLRSFTLTPRLPATWDEMRLRNIAICETAFDLIIKRTKAGLECRIIRQGNTVQQTSIKEGKTINVNL